MALTEFCEAPCYIFIHVCLGSECCYILIVKQKYVGELNMKPNHNPDPNANPNPKTHNFSKP